MGIGGSKEKLEYNRSVVTRGEDGKRRAGGWGKHQTIVSQGGSAGEEKKRSK